MKTNPRMRPLTIACLALNALIAAGALALAFHASDLRRAHAPEPVAEQPETDVVTPEASSTHPVTPNAIVNPRVEQASRRAPDLLPAVEQSAVLAAAKIESPAALGPYLAQLEDTARRNRRVSAFEVEPGLAAIARVYPDHDEGTTRAAEFSRRMYKLSAEFDPSVTANAADLPQ